MIEVSYVYGDEEVALRRFATYSRPVVGDKMKIKRRTSSDIRAVVKSVREDIYCGVPLLNNY